VSIETLRDLLWFIKENKTPSYIEGGHEFRLYGVNGWDCVEEIIAIKKEYFIVNVAGRNNYLIPLSSISSIVIKDPLPQALISGSAIKQKDN